VELDATEQPQGPSPRRRIHTRLGLAIVIAVVAVVGAAGLAFAKTRPAPIGTGIVVIDTDLAYQGGQAAGTGMVLSSNGTILTNNHVIRGATTLRVVVPSTGRSYSARVVGYDSTDDVAVIQATGASNLKTLPLASSSGLSNGQSVTAIGNAGGTGRLTTATGTVTGTGHSITVSDDQGGSEHLTGMIETNADVQPGDSGGPLLNSAGKAIGMDTAASEANGYQDASETSQGFAIPINKALSIALKIMSGESSSTVHIGGTAFLGVEVESNSYGSGAVVTQVVPGGPADNAGLSAGDVITGFDGQSVSSPTALTTIVSDERSGSTSTVTVEGQDGSSQTVNITLGSGPPR